MKTAIKAGYRNIDTAEGYMNEKGVGEGVRQAMEEYGLRREGIFVRTKPKSTHEKYIMENADVFDFLLSEEDMASIDRLPYCGGMMFDPDRARS